MPNDFKNTELVTKYAVKEFLNALQLGSKIDRQLDTKNIFAGKIGASVKIRRPVMFESTEGAEIQSGETSDIEEATITFTLNERRKVVFDITTEDLTLEIAEANERYIKPAMVELAQQVESVIADVGYKGFFNFVGTPGVSPGSFLAVAQAGAKLDNLGVPMDEERVAFYDPDASVTLADSLKGVFPMDIAKKAIERALIGQYGGFTLFKNQSLKIHTVGVNTGTPLVDGAGQNVTYLTSKDTGTQTLNTDGWTNDTAGILLTGDVFTIADVFSVNRRTRESTGSLAQFVLTADAASGAATGPATLVISPPIIIDGPYQTVTQAPANNAIITVLTGVGGSTHRQNIAFHKNAITLATVQLDLPIDGATASRQNFMGVSIRAVRQYNFTTDKNRFRFDILFGVKVQNPGFGVRTTS